MKVVVTHGWGSGRLCPTTSSFEVRIGELMANEPLSDNIYRLLVKRDSKDKIEENGYIHTASRVLA